jgi:hypothetical protein
MMRINDIVAAFTK